MAVIIIDLILSKLKIHKKYLQLLGITAIFITVKVTFTQSMVCLKIQVLVFLSCKLQILSKKLANMKKNIYAFMNLLYSLLLLLQLRYSLQSEESFIYTLTHACEHCANAYTKEEVSAMEMLILKTLKWKLQYPTPGEIARRLVQLTNSMLGVNLAKFFKKTDNFVDLAISGNFKTRQVS